MQPQFPPHCGHIRSTQTWRSLTLITKRPPCFFVLPVTLLCCCVYADKMRGCLSELGKLMLSFGDFRTQKTRDSPGFLSVAGIRSEFGAGDFLNGLVVILG